FSSHPLYCCTRTAGSPTRRKDARMVRIVSPLPILLIILVPAAFAQPAAESDPRISRAVAVQRAMADAKELLRANRPRDAVAVLEAQILYVNGNPSYLALMKDAYVASMKEIADKNGSPERLEHVRRQLRILDPMINLDEIAAAPTKSRGPVVRAVSG